MKKLVLVASALLLAGCLTPHPPPPPAPYLAKGHSPQWSLIIDERHITFIGAPGGTPVVQPTPPVIGGIAGDIYQTPRIGVNIVHVPCTDPATGRAHADRVQVDVDGRRFEGCGGEAANAPAVAGLPGTRWRVVAVNGRPTPAAGDYWVSFDARRIGGRIGCNSFGGSYIQNRTSLDVDGLSGTAMACADPAMSFEREGWAILQRPMRMSWNGNRLTLANEAGRIELSRSS